MALPKKGQINQVLFTLVDKTDGLTVESGITNSSLRLSGAAKLYGLVHGGSTAVTSAALTKPLRTATGADNTTGQYRAVLTAAECVYDEIGLRIRHPSAATQHLVIDFVDYDDSDIASTLAIIQSLASDAHSQAARTYSRVLLNASTTSDIQSYLVAMSAALSDVQSQAERTYSRVLLNASTTSDIQSYLVALSAQLSDVYSAVGGIGGTGTYSRLMLVASNASDIQSYLVGMSAMLSDVHSQAARTYSRVILDSSNISDVQSYLVALSAQLSDVYSAVGGIGGTGTYSRLLLVASNASDIQSYLVAMSAMLSDTHSQAARGYSRILLNASVTSDIQSYLVGLSGELSDVYSTVKGIGAAANVYSRVLLVDSGVNQLQSRVSSDIITASDLLSRMRGEFNSDLSMTYSAAKATQSLASDAHSQAARTYSRLLLVGSVVSDVQSYAQALSGQLSDVYSYVQGIGAAANTYSRVMLIGSVVSDIQSYLVGMSGMLSDTHSQSARGYSRALLNASTISDVQSYLVGLSAQLSDVYSGINAIGAGGTYSRLMLVASVVSDIQSQVVGLSDVASNIYVNANRAASRALITQSQASDVYSLLRERMPAMVATSAMLTTEHAYLVGMSGMLSDIQSGLATVGVDPGTYSRLMLVASNTSDVQSYLRAMSTMLSDTHSQAARTYSRVLLNASVVSDVQSALEGVRGDVSDVYSRVLTIATPSVTLAASDISLIADTVASAVGDQVASQTYELMKSDLSDIYSLATALNYKSDDIYSAAQRGASVADLNASNVSNIYSLLLDTNKGKERVIGTGATAKYEKYGTAGALLWSHTIESDATSVVRGQGA